METKKLIEVALPLDKINEASEREKSIRHGHPSAIHMWWARRPLATARAVIWSSLVDDPSSHPELFPTEDEQRKERERLFEILEKLVVWENSNNKKILEQAKEEIRKSIGDSMPELLDPFAGGGAIPFEAQRLGLKAYANDLNPVAVMINKAMIDIPARFSGMSPVHCCVETLHEIKGVYSGAEGMAEDVSYYGELLKKKAYKKLESNYPKLQLPSQLGGGEANVVAWIWTRTVKCPNPLCGCNMPLVRSFVLSKKKGKEAYIEPIITKEKIAYEVHNGIFKGKQEGTVDRKGAVCIKCGAPVDFDYIRNESKAGRMNVQMMAVVGDKAPGRIYVTPDSEQLNAAQIERPDNYPEGELAYYPGHLNTNAYGLNTFDKLFTDRQLATLVIFSDLIKEVQNEIEKDALESGMLNDHVSLEAEGRGAFAYAQAISVYLSFLIDQMTNQSSSVCGWNSTNSQMRCVFSRQAIPMVWDYAECNIFSDSTGSITSLIDRMVKGIKSLGNLPRGVVSQADAQTDCGLRNIMVSTDPPYYDNIGYADLSDFFYVWLRKNLKEIYPKLFSTMLVPKKEELVATQYRFDGDVDQARLFFEEGMLQTCKRIFDYSKSDIPVTIYYAYKASKITTCDGIDKKSSSGWETMLSSIINAGFQITGTWPMRTEKPGRSIGNGANALASSIVLVCRKRLEDAPQTTRRNLINILKKELRPALKNLQESNIAPVDMAQSAIGPGMAVFSRYRRVLEADGTPMTVRSALQVINEEIDLYFNEQVGEMDAASRFCIDLYTQSAYNDIKYGEAEVLANAKGTSIPMMASYGLLYAKAGIVHLIERSELPTKVDTNAGNVWMLTQQLAHAMGTGGIESCAKIIVNMFGSNAERAKDLAYRLYTIAEQKKWANEAYAYNALVVAWPDIQSRAAALKAIQPKQLSLFDMM